MENLRLPDIARGTPFEIEIDGRKVLAHPGESLATVLAVAGLRSFASHPEPYPPSRLFCGMGICRQCLVTIDDLPNCRACQTQARPGMKVQTNNAQ